MTIDEVVQRIGNVGIIPVVRASSADEAQRAVDTICAAGIDVIEVTMTVPDAQLIPTGGVNVSNAAEYIAAGAFALGIGADLVDLAALRQGQTQKILEAARALVEAVRQARQGSTTRPSQS